MQSVTSKLALRTSTNGIDSIKILGSVYLCVIPHILMCYAILKNGEIVKQICQKKFQRHKKCLFGVQKLPWEKKIKKIPIYEIIKMPNVSVNMRNKVWRKFELRTENLLYMDKLL